jgi:hypothetical protein
MSALGSTGNVVFLYCYQHKGPQVQHTKKTPYRHSFKDLTIFCVAHVGVDNNQQLSGNHFAS